MSETITPDLCIIGAGSAGLSIAAGAQQMGADCVLIEKGLMPRAPRKWVPRWCWSKAARWAVIA